MVYAAALAVSRKRQASAPSGPICSSTASAQPETLRGVRDELVRRAFRFHTVPEAIGK